MKRGRLQSRTGPAGPNRGRGLRVCSKSGRGILPSFREPRLWVRSSAEKGVLSCSPHFPQDAQRRADKLGRHARGSYL